MSTIVFANLAYMVFAAFMARRQLDHAVDVFAHNRTQQTDAWAFALESQRQQARAGLANAVATAERTFELRSWPLVRSAQQLRESLSRENPRPLLALLVVPPSIKGGSAEQYTAELAQFARQHLGDALNGRVKFVTGLWQQGRELDDAAVASLEAELPEQPMALLGFALRGGDRIEPRLAYLPGPGGLPTQVVPLCKEPIPFTALLNETERLRAVDRATVIQLLRAENFSEGEIAQLVGAVGMRNLLVERAERVLEKVGVEFVLGETLDDGFAASRTALARAESVVINLLKLALTIVADAHGLLVYKLVPQLPLMLEELHAAIPAAVRHSLPAVLDDYERLFNFPSIATTTATQIALLQLRATRAAIEGRACNAFELLMPWFSARRLPSPVLLDDAIAAFAQHAGTADAAYLEAVGLLFEQQRNIAVARRFYQLADAVATTSQPLSIDARYGGNDQ